MTALVTGAGSGIGRAIAGRLAALGAEVVGVGRRTETLAETAAEIGDRFRFETCDLRDLDAASELVQRVGAAGGLDIVVNNAGGQFSAPATEITPKGWQAVIDLNLTALFNLTRAAYPFLAEQGGAVVNISLTPVERGARGMAHAIAARAGVLGLTRTLALEWAPNRIRLNCIGPGTVLSRGLEDEADRATVDRLIAATPFGRPTEAAEVAELVAFLAGPAGCMITGQLIQIDGAAHLGPGLHMIEEEA
jgi:citronellol/citronellal dehydrogenase